MRVRHHTTACCARARRRRRDDSRRVGVRAGRARRDRCARTGRAPFPEATAQQLQDAVSHAMVAAGASGAIVGVWAPWSGTLVTGLGVDVPASGSKPSRPTWSSASAQLTRPMICDVLYASPTRAPCSSNDSVTKWVTGFLISPTVTLGQLCDSTSGIGSYSPQLGAALPLQSRPASGTLASSRATASASRATPSPEPRIAIRTRAIILLGLALERATGRSAAESARGLRVRPAGSGRDPAAPERGRQAVRDGPVLNGHHSLPDAAGR